MQQNAGQKVTRAGLHSAAKNWQGKEKTQPETTAGNTDPRQAGMIIRQLSNKPDQTSWDIPLPERQILGSNEREVERQLVKIFEQAKTRK